MAEWCSQRSGWQMTRGRWLVGIGWLASLVGAGAAGWWAANETLVLPQDPLQESAPVTYRVAEGDVGLSVNLSVLAEWPTQRIALNQAEGIVTAIADQHLISEGDVLYEVGERPTVSGHGEVPAYRDLVPGDQGRDVAQLQRLLVASGFAAVETTGIFDDPTEVAVRGWQESLGSPADGRIDLGDIVWFPSLPRRVLLGDEILVGARLTGGEEILALDDQPSLVVPVSAEQRDLVPPEAEVTVTLSSGAWVGVVDDIKPRSPDRGGGFDLVLVSSDGAAICGNDCEAIPVGERSEYLAEIVLIPPATGSVVPAASITTRPDGSTYVVSPEGTELEVVVLGAQGSIVLVSGVDIGTEILVFGPEP